MPLPSGTHIEPYEILAPSAPAAWAKSIAPTTPASPSVTNRHRRRELWRIPGGTGDNTQHAVPGRSGGLGISDWFSMLGQTPGALGLLRFYWIQTPYENPQLFWDRSPLAHADKVRTPTLIYAGEDDPIVHVSQSREFFRALRHFGVPAELIIYPREGHGVVEPNHLTQNPQAILNWFDRYMKP